MFEVLYHSPKILGVSSLENQFARLWISAQKQFPPVPRSLFLLFQPKKSLLCFRKIIFLRVDLSAKNPRNPPFLPKNNLLSRADLSAPVLYGSTFLFFEYSISFFNARGSRESACIMAYDIRWNLHDCPCPTWKF